MGSTSAPEAIEARPRSGVAALDAVLVALQAAPDLGARVVALEALASWVRKPDGALPLPAEETDPAFGDPRYRRLAVLTVTIERSNAARVTLREALRDVLVHGDALALFAEVGIPEQHGLIEEAFERIQRRILPAPRDERDLGKFLGRVLPNARAAAWLEQAPPRLLDRLSVALEIGDDSLAHVREASTDALRLLAARAEAIGLSRPMRDRRARVLVRDSPWYRLSRRTEALAGRLDSPAGPEIEAVAHEWRENIAAVRAENQQVLDHLETSGISIELVFAIEACTRMLDRMSMIAELRLVAAGEARTAARVRVLAILARERARADSLGALARDASRQLARRVVERAGASGEHYITTSAWEYGRMFLSAAWGGIVTVWTAAWKITITALHLPVLPEGLVNGFNYATSFTFMQATHGTLATKQPSMTASTLAGILEESDGPHRAEEMATFFARIARSQLVAAFGNVTACALGAYAFDHVWWIVNRRHFIEEEKAEAILASMHVIGSGTIWYAALTGVLLWLSSLTAGSIENWTAYRRIPRAIAEHSLGARFGRERMQRCAAWFARNISAYAGSVVLGFLLGLAPVLGKITGLPIDVRHVTLSTGQVAFAASSLDLFFDPRVGWAIAGVSMMFVLNLGVSFSLALWVAMRARGVGASEHRAVLKAVLRRIVHHPEEFMFPTRARADKQP